LKPTLSPKNTFLLSSYDLWKALVWLLWLRPNFSIKKKFEKTLPDPQKQLPVKLSGPLGGPGWLWWPLQPFFHFSPGRVKNPYPNPNPNKTNQAKPASVQSLLNWRTRVSTFCQPLFTSVFFAHHITQLHCPFTPTETNTSHLFNFLVMHCLCSSLLLCNSPVVFAFFFNLKSKFTPVYSFCAPNPCLCHAQALLESQNQLCSNFSFSEDSSENQFFLYTAWLGLKVVQLQQTYHLPDC
jgi:hypothetical protein